MFCSDLSDIARPLCACAKVLPHVAAYGARLDQCVIVSASQLVRAVAIAVDRGFLRRVLTRVIIEEVAGKIR
jgi:hypothetical protein